MNNFVSRVFHRQSHLSSLRFYVLKIEIFLELRTHVEALFCAVDKKFSARSARTPRAQDSQKSSLISIRVSRTTETANYAPAAPHRSLPKVPPASRAKRKSRPGTATSHR